MFQLSPSSLQNLLEKGRELREGRPEGVSLSAYLQATLMDRFPEITASEAEQIVTDLQYGVREFNSRYLIVKQNEKEVDLLPLLEGLSIEDKFNALVNLQTVLQVYLQEPKSLSQEDLDAIRSTIVGQREPSEASIAQLQEELSGRFMQIQLDAIGVDSVRAILSSSELTPETALDFLNDESNAHYAALVAYICRREGDEALQAAPSDNRLLGSTIAAGFAQATNDLLLATNQITQSQWERLTKGVLGTLLFLVLLAADLLTNCIVGLGLMALVMSVLGTSMFSLIVAFGLVWVCCDYVADKGSQAVFYLLDKAGAWYDRVVAWLRSKFQTKRPAGTQTAEETATTEETVTTEGTEEVEEGQTMAEETTTNEQLGSRNLQPA